MTRKEIKFTDIVQMIADGSVPDGAKFYTHSYRGSSAMISASMSGKGADAFLYWDGNTGEPSDHMVQLSQDVLSDTWYIEVPEVELSLEEAIAEWKACKVVEVEYRGSRFTFNRLTDFEDIWKDTNLVDLGNLLFHTKFYKVAA